MSAAPGGGPAQRAPWPGDDAVFELLGAVRRIAVVGLSADPGRPSHGVAAYLKRRGYAVVPVRPDGEAILGEPVRRSLAECGPVDLVVVFRRSESAGDVVAEGLGAGLRAFWLQEGVVSAEGAVRAQKAGAFYVEDRCVMKEHRRLGAGRGGDAAGDG